jgi:O-antigen ligase
VDPTAAQQAAEETSRISQACSDASFLMTMLASAVTFSLLMAVPFLTLIGLAGSWVVRIGLPILTIRWWVRYWGIRSDDHDFLRAKRYAMFGTLGTLAVWGVIQFHIR